MLTSVCNRRGGQGHRLLLPEGCGKAHSRGTGARPRRGRELGCLDTAGLAETRRGKSPTVQKGPYKGQDLSVDRIIPKVVVPELDNVIANLELLSLRLNESKNAKIGYRRLSHAQKLRQAGLLSAEGLKKVQNARGERLRSGANRPPGALMLSLFLVGFQDLEDRRQPTRSNMFVSSG